MELNFFMFFMPLDKILCHFNANFYFQCFQWFYARRDPCYCYVCVWVNFLFLVRDAVHIHVATRNVKLTFLFQPTHPPLETSSRGIHFLGGIYPYWSTLYRKYQTVKNGFPVSVSLFSRTLSYLCSYGCVVFCGNLCMHNTGGGGNIVFCNNWKNKKIRKKMKFYSYCHGRNVTEVTSWPTHPPNTSIWRFLWQHEYGRRP